MCSVHLHPPRSTSKVAYLEYLAPLKEMLTRLADGPLAATLLGDFNTSPEDFASMTAEDPFWREFAAVAPDGEKTASGTNPCDSSCAGLCWSELIQQHDLFTDAVKAKWATLCFTALVKKRQVLGAATLRATAFPLLTGLASQSSLTHIAGSHGCGRSVQRRALPKVSGALLGTWRPVQRLPRLPGRTWLGALTNAGGRRRLPERKLKASSFCGCGGTEEKECGVRLYERLPTGIASQLANCWRFVATVPQLSRAISSRKDLGDEVRKDSFFAKRSREDFEEIVTFLASVPLFKNQLPRSELPKVARSLKRKVWEPGTEIVKQGDLGKAFFLIMSGEADVLTRSADSCNDHVRATLRKGDYFGGRTLLEERSNVATIRASGEASLVTLSMSRRAFHDTGIDKQLKFPKRAAIYNEHPAAATPGDFRQQRMGKATLGYSSTQVRNNANLRALIETDQEQLSKIAACAEQRIVEKGTEVAKRGEVGDEFFIIREGSFDIVLGH
ncbi:PKAR [Symbiodinium natans]|uniref:PKAR protein n=1 Tax=Symbiodinium natans TaxID=878477 RepID=A0A812M422_9DINO|nr:PKAR [Symbiodinium natans]